MFLKIGHRGAAGYGPEDTLLSFKKALELNVDMFDLDVHICKTGELVVIHDEKVDRTTNGQGYVIDKTLAELKTLDAGQGEKIPSLVEVLDFIDKKVRINIELKSVGTAKLVSKLIKDYVKDKNWQYTDFFVSSFNHYELKEFSELTPAVEIGALITGIPIGLAGFAEKIKATAVNLNVEFINQEFIADAHRRGLKVFVFTVDDPDDIKKMKQLGVEGIFSNFPDRL
jgi:glycerophosphoryl diester phosphodiesterase